MEIEIRIKKVRKALKSGNVKSVEFYSDGSGASFYYKDPTGDHGMPCMMQSSFKMEEVIKIVSGFRFKQHDIPTCF